MEARERVQLNKILRVVGIFTFFLIAGALSLGISTARQMKEIIRAQFNEQQLVLARTAAGRVEISIQNAIADIVLLNSLSTIQHCEPEQYEALLVAALPILNRDDIKEISRVDQDGNTLFVANDQGIAMRHFGLGHVDAAAYLSWASSMSNRGKTMAAGIRPKDPVGDRRHTVMDLIIPTYQDSTDSRHPWASHRFAGYLRATVDISELLKKIMTPVRSGKTGYSWVLDSSGTFLYHPESSFLGENAFEIRSNRNPGISFNQINQIQREEMLQGKEGVGTYTSGWHRDVIEPMEKLIAYTPVRIQGPFHDYTWSVAVVAPLHEIEGIIHQVYGRQILLQGLILLVILVCGAMVVLYELRWTTILEHEIAVKTKDLRTKAAELERSEANYRSLVEGAEDLIFTLCYDGVIRSANRHMTRIFGVEAGSLVGRSIAAFLPEEHGREQLNMVGEAIMSGKAQRAEVVFQVHNEPLWFHIQYIPIQGEGADSPIILGIARDITDRKSLEKQLINTEKLASLGTLAAGVAHEINNPLGIMLGFCDLLQEKIEPGTMEYNDLKIIERHGLHCKGIIERLLSFARISDETEEYCDVNSNIEAILSVVRHTLDMNNIAPVVHLGEGLPLVRGDSRGLQQVFLNLINNAIYAMENQGTLSITTHMGKTNDRVEVRVSDTGCGIKAEFLEKIFDPFFTTKKVGDGTGLGLSVSYGIITKYGGSITCESWTEEERPGHSGTTFTITIPVKGEE